MGGRGVLVWGGIMLGSRTDLHIFDAGQSTGLQFLFMDDNAMSSHSSCRTPLREQTLGSSYLTTSNDSGASIGAARRWAAMPQQPIDTLILSMGRRCETCLAVREIISPTKDRMFLAGHPSQGCFGLQSHCAPCYFFNQASFYPSDFSFYKRWQQVNACWWKGKRGGRPLTTSRRVLPLNWGDTELNRSVTCMVLKATDNDRRHLAFAMMNFVGLDLAFADEVALVTTDRLKTRECINQWIMTSHEIMN
ncbi:transposable element Tcb2 transposase [Trichonephila clavipes]|nr:transposable element Tcb2 transposase [Trichonephila clavipes]